MKKNNFIKIFVGFFVFSILFTFLYTISYCADTDVLVSSEFVDLQFTIGSKKYTSKKIVNNLDVEPEIKNNRTMLPFRVFFEELGYKIEWNEKTKSISATDGKKTIKLTISSKTAYVNDKAYQLETVPYLNKGRTLIPLRFIAEQSGANVVWDNLTKTISITRLGQYDTGSVLYYDQTNASKEKRAAYVYDGKTIQTIPLKDQLIKNSFPYKGSILITLLESDIDSYNLVTYEDGKFKVLLENFEIVDSLEFNDCLLLQGYDRQKKVNNLYKYDGVSLIKLKEDFTIGEHIIYNDKLIINKYDSFRNYSIVAIDKNWEINELQKDVIIKDTLIEDNLLFIAAKNSTGSESPFAIYNGTIFKIISKDLDIDLKRTIQYTQKNSGTYIVTIAKTVLSKTKEYFKAIKYDINNSDPSNTKVYDIYLDENIIKTAALSKSTESSLIKNNNITKACLGPNSTNPNTMYPSSVTINAIKDFNGYIYVAFQDASSIYIADTFKTNTSNSNTLELSLTTSPFGKDNPPTLHNNCNYISSLQYENQLLFQFQYKTTSNTDYMLYIYNKTNSGGTDFSYVIDVKTINKIIQHMGKLFLDVKDIDRLTTKERFTLILFDPKQEKESRVKNLVIGMETKMWEAVDNALVINGFEADINKYKIYVYSDKFDEILSNFKSTYWRKIDNKVYVSGTDSDSTETNLYSISSIGKTLIHKNFDATKVEKASNDYFFINTKITDKNSKYVNKKILFIWTPATNKFTDVAVDIDLTDIVHFK